MDPMRSGEEEELSSDLQVHGGGQLIEELGRPTSVPLLFAPQGNVNITAKLDRTGQRADMELMAGVQYMEESSLKVKASGELRWIYSTWRAH